MKRLSDILFSSIGLLILSPLLIGISLWVILDSRGGALFRQVRVGKDGKEFRLLKFRTMRPASENQGLLSLGSGDRRITAAGKVLRKYKLDELPQLLNVLWGQMSMVGPRPEVPKYVALYNDDQRKALSVKPGLTDFASIAYFDEGEKLARSADPEKTYIEEIMAEKLDLAVKYVEEQSLATDMRILMLTLARIIGFGRNG